MPYLINTEEKEWRLFMRKECSPASTAMRKKKELTIISGVYVIHEYRHSEVCAFMVERYAPLLSLYPYDHLQPPAFLQSCGGMTSASCPGGAAT